jgi:CBS domain-containing protein
MLVSEILAANSRPLITAAVSTTIHEAMDLMIEHKISCLLVVNEHRRLVGIVSDKDIFRLAHTSPNNFVNHTVWDVMTEGVMTALPSDDIYQVAALMTRYRFRHVPIVENEHLIGLISIGDIVKAQLDSMQDENSQLRKYISGDYPA